MKVKSESEVAQSFPTLSDLMDCSLPGSSVHGIFQAGVLEWGAIAFFREVELGFSNSSDGFSDSSVVKNPPSNAGDTDWIPDPGRVHGEGNSYSLQYSCLENLMNRGAW